MAYRYAARLGLNAQNRRMGVQQMLNEIKAAMCGVIYECGINSMDSLKVHTFDWSVTIDGHTLTKQEYDEWAKQNGSKKQDA